MVLGQIRTLVLEAETQYICGKLYQAILLPFFKLLWNPMWFQTNATKRQGMKKGKRQLPCDRARQWLSPMEMSTTRVVASSSISLGRSAVASEEPHPRQAPQPQAYTWEKTMNQHKHLFDPFPEKKWFSRRKKSKSISLREKRNSWICSREY